MLAPPRFAANAGLDERLTRDLTQRLGADDLNAWIEERTVALARLGYQKPGFIGITDELLAELNVKGLRETDAELATLAQLRPLVGRLGYEVLFRKPSRKQSGVDQRFWIAHELAHKLWLQPTGDGRSLSPCQKPWGSDPTIEWLCNRAGAALLLPRPLLQLTLERWKKSVDMWPIPLERLPELATLFRLPIQLVARRWLHDLMQWNLAVVCLERCGESDHASGNWTVRWDAVPRSGHFRAKSLYGRLVPSSFLPPFCENAVKERRTREVELPGHWRGFLK